MRRIDYETEFYLNKQEIPSLISVVGIDKVIKGDIDEMRQQLIAEYLYPEETKNIKTIKPDYPDYKKGFEILIEYFDCLNIEDKKEIDERLKKVGL